jgi:exopolysaccharide production protein ExoY
MDLSAVILALPLLVVLASLIYGWIQIVSPGAVLFRQTRIGRGGKPFTIYKFRSMNHQAATHVHEAHVEHLIRFNEPMVKLDLVGDPRLIKGGCLIRQSGLDELPQLINVLKGEMSLTGPRPCLPSEARHYDAGQLRRFHVLPGLTGIWQVRREESTTFLEMVAMDDEYVDRLSPVGDLSLILKTPFALLGQMKRCAKTRVRKPGVLSDSARGATARPAYSVAMTSTRKFSD